MPSRSGERIGPPPRTRARIAEIGSRPCRTLAAPALALAVLLSPARAADDGHGELDFSKLDKKQEDYLWRRIEILAFEEALATHCGRPDDFEDRARKAIQACVTEDALNRADAFYRTYLRKNKEHINSLGDKWVCKGPFALNGHKWDDEGVVVAEAELDLDHVLEAIRDMCQKCKSSIWALLCR